MFRKTLCFALLSKFRLNYPNPIVNRGFVKFLHTSNKLYTDEAAKVEIIPYVKFEDARDKSKQTYLDMVKIFENRSVHRRGHVEFIYEALKHMEMFGVENDLESYKALIDVLPKGKFIPENMFQSEFMHYPKQQHCILDLLEQMEDNGVMPDLEMEDMLLNIFGKRGFPLRKYWRMMYWMPKFKNLSPWPLPRPVPNDIFELAKLAIERIVSVDIQSTVTIFDTKDVADSLEKTWIVSGQSPFQRKLLKEHDPETPLYVEGAFRIWLRNKAVNYFILRSDPVVLPQDETDESDDVSHINAPAFGFTIPQKKELGPLVSVHEQEDGIIYAVCATGSSGRDSLLSWIRLLEKNGNPILSKVPVVFTLRSPSNEIVIVNDDGKEKLEDR